MSYRKIRYPRLTALLAIVLAAINLRAAITALGALLPAVQEDLSLSGTTVGILGTIPTMMFAISAFILPQLKARMTLSEIMVLSLSLTTVGQFLRVVYPHPLVLIAGSIVALFAIGILNTTMPLVVREYFPNRIPTMSLTYMITAQAGLSIAPIFGVPIMNWANSEGWPGWQVSLGLWAFVSMVAGMAWLPLLVRHGPNPVTDAPKPNFNIPVWRTRVGVGLALLFGCNSLIGYTLLTFLPNLYLNAGASEEMASGMLVLVSVSGLPLSFIGTWLVGRFRRLFPTVIVIGICVIVGHLGLALSPLSHPWLWVLLAAVGTMAFSIATVLINIRARTIEGATGLTSFTQGFGYTVASAGPLLTGLLSDVTGSLGTGMYILSAAGIVMTAGGYFATREVHVEDQLAELSR